MRVGLLSASVIAALAVAGAASAQTVTGTVNITGTVNSKCSVNGSGGPSAFSDTWNLGDLADTDGTLTAIPAQSTTGDGIQVSCTSRPFVSIDASPIVNVAPAPGPGYTNTVNYTAYADFLTVPSATETITDASGGAGSSPAQLTAHLQNVTDNVVVRADTFVTANASDILVSGPYSGTIIVTITP
ncbi:MAG TPA: hypothetical protein VEF55_10070 [Candidatus Binatia bacterium]|nr:hypothetical protein [Candidatus Binatia bacterium]